MDAPGSTTLIFNAPACIGGGQRIAMIVERV